MKEEDSLKGKLLVAMPTMGDVRFHHAVILICSHDKNGAMGLVLNNPLTGLSFDHMIEHLKIKAADIENLKKIEVLGGGPVETARGFVVHKNDYASKETIEISDDMSITGTLDVLKEIINGDGPKPFLFVLGYAGWTAGQIESELSENSWLVVTPDHALIYDVKPAQKWRMALAKMGIEPGFLSVDVGHG